MPTPYPTETEIGAFVEQLAAVPSTASATNFYAANSRGGEVRRHNLATYLVEMANRCPRALLVGEAPGYRGTRVTGVPFASERVLLEGIPPLAFLGVNRGYRAPPAGRTWTSEQTSTIVWQVLSQYRFLPLLWATFPFHPHAPGDRNSNRKPTALELAQGRPFLESLLDTWKINRVVAVGNVAERSLRSLGVTEVQRIRHPARGGKQQFAEGIARLAKDDAIYRG